MIPTLQSSIKTYWLWYTLGVAGALTFLFWPGGFADKARVVLHGLCAQTPSHSFTLGGVMLPFDARMTGIYGGAISTLVILAGQGRILFSGLPPLRVMALLAAFVLALAADGFNSFFTDLGLWHPWTPRNELRLITGFGTGTSLAIVLTWLIGSTVWRVSSRERVVRSLREVALYWIPFMPWALIMMSGASWLYVPISMILMLSAWTVMTLLALSMVLLALRWDDRVRAARHLHIPGTIAALVGLVVMLTLAFGRVWLESVLGIPATV